MAATFDITQNAGDSHQVNPFWLVVFVPFKNRVSFNAATMASTQDALQDPVGSEDTIIADGDVLTVSTSSSKENHISGCSMTLFHDAIDYRQLVSGGDWVLVWMFDNVSDYSRIRAALVKNSFESGLNGPQDGFKFVGRISSCRRKKTRQPDGKLITTYSIAANGFTEMDSTQYFNPLLKDNVKAVQYLSDFGVDSKNILTGFGLANSQVLIPSIIQLGFGFGPGVAASQLVPVTGSLAGADPDGTLSAIAASMQNQRSPNRTYQIPTVVWEMLGVSNLPAIKNGHPSYADILRIYIGVHDYESAVTGGGAGLQDFVPAFQDTANGVFYSDNPLQGVFFPPRLDFNMQSLWSIVKTFLNEPVNEMYTCLRLDPTGHVMPTLMIRQMPFTSQHFRDRVDNSLNLQPENGGPADNWTSTPYLTVPRWVIDDSMIYDEDTGRTDGTRANYVHVTGSDALAQDPNASGYIAIIDAPPIVDSADIFRSGLRISEHPLAAALDLQTQGVDSAAARFYTQFFADILINGQLKYQGTVQLNGIQAPICEGDNCVVGGIIYHIERVEHTAGFVDINRGTKSFMTTLSLTHGVDIASDTDDNNQGLFVYPGDSGNTDTQTVDKQISSSSDGVK